MPIKNYGFLGSCLNVAMDAARGAMFWPALAARQNQDLQGGLKNITESKVSLKYR